MAIEDFLFVKHPVVTSCNIETFKTSSCNFMQHSNIGLKVGEILRRGAVGGVCTEPNLKVLLKCFLSKDKDVLNQVL